MGAKCGQRLHLTNPTEVSSEGNNKQLGFVYLSFKHCHNYVPTPRPVIYIVLGMLDVEKMHSSVHRWLLMSCMAVKAKNSGE